MVSSLSLSQHIMKRIAEGIPMPTIRNPKTPPTRATNK